MIPNEWSVESLDECSNVTKLAGFEFTEYMKYIDDGEVIALRALNLKNGKLDLQDIKKIDRQVSESLTRSKLYINDVLFSYVGTVGEVALIEENDKFHLAPNVAKITFNDLMFPKFALQYLMSSNIKNEINKYITTTSQAALSMENIRKMKVIVPTKKEQEKIASILSTVDEQIDNVEGLIQKNKEIKKGLMQQLLSKGIGHTKFNKTEIGDIPEDWEVIKLSELAEIKRGASPRPINNPKWFSENKKVGWIRISDVTKTKKYLKKTEQYLSEEGIAKSRLVKPNNLIMSICATVGKPIILKMEACIHDGFILFDNLDRSRVNINYLYYLLQKKEEEFKSMGQTGTQANLNTNLVGSTLIALPKIQEQEKMELILSEVDEKIEEYENKKQKLEELKKGLMQQLLTGKVRVI